MTNEQLEECCGIAPDGQTCAVQRVSGELVCPRCNTRLRSVSVAHVMRQVRNPISTGFNSAASFGFCPSHGCPVVFLGSGGERFETRDLRYAPAYKTGNPTDLLCYCFDVTGDFALSTTADAAVGFISDRVRAGDCACDVLNPAAGCCLGSIARYRKDHPAR